MWGGVGREELETYCGNRNMRDWKLRRPQRELLHMVWFGIFANPHVVLQTDKKLITALVERWRPETNTFHMRPGELTVTLEDVGYILGLPIFGEALSGGLIDGRKNYFGKNWFEPLSDNDVKDATYRGNIKLSWCLRNMVEKSRRRGIFVSVLFTHKHICYLSVVQFCSLLVAGVLFMLDTSAVK